MVRIYPDAILSHWHKLLTGVQASPQSFYAALGEAIDRRGVPGIVLSRVAWREAGVLSPRREYLQALRGSWVFHICAAPFGNDFFVSWWLGESERGFAAWFSNLRIIGAVFRPVLMPLTYFQIDTALQFQTSIQCAVLEVIDQLTAAKGLRGLTELDRRPIMREFFVE